MSVTQALFGRGTVKPRWSVLGVRSEVRPLAYRGDAVAVEGFDVIGPHNPSDTLRNGAGLPDTHSLRCAFDFCHRRCRALRSRGEPSARNRPLAVQQGHYVARLIRQEAAPDQRRSFVYSDRGMLATMGARKLWRRWDLAPSGLPAWSLWCAVHIFLLIELRSRVRVMSEWIWYYLAFQAGRKNHLYEDAVRLAKKRKHRRGASAGV